MVVWRWQKLRGVQKKRPKMRLARNEPVQGHIILAAVIISPLWFFSACDRPVMAAADAHQWVRESTSESTTEGLMMDWSRCNFDPGACPINNCRLLNGRLESIIITSALSNQSPRAGFSLCSALNVRCAVYLLRLRSQIEAPARRAMRESCSQTEINLARRAFVACCVRWDVCCIQFQNCGQFWAQHSSTKRINSTRRVGGSYFQNSLAWFISLVEKLFAWCTWSFRWNIVFTSPSSKVIMNLSQQDIVSFNN